MAKTLCSAGVVKSVSYLMLPVGDGIVAKVKTPDKEITVTHTDLDIAKLWLDNKIDEELRKTNYEID